MEEKWFLTTKKADFSAIGQKYGIDPVLARVLRNREVNTDEEIRAYLHGSLEDLPGPYLLKDMDKAINLLLDKKKEKIRVIGDYDIDGVTSTYILVRGLRELRFQVDYAIPHRMLDGYGLNERLIEEAHADGIGLIITCDNGISAVSQIELAKSYGMQVIVTDHHEVPYEADESGAKQYILPAADAVVDPKREDCTYPFKGICGGFVAYQFVRALYERTEYVNERLMSEFTEIAAFATIGDVMELKGDNRILVKEGLRRMQHTGNLGLRALIRACDLSGKEIMCYHIGFVLGPCMNATGRLDYAGRALELLLSEDEQNAYRIAMDLRSMNESRKSLTGQGVERAEELMKDIDLSTDPVIVLYLPGVHESIAGIIAGKVRERYNHPAIILTDAEDGDLKGSGRSVEGYDLFGELVRVKELLTKFGGHTLAAGLSLKKENLPELTRRLNANCLLKEEAGDFDRKIHIDVNMPLSYVNMSFTESLSILEPFGNGNEKPVFGASSLLFKSAYKVGSSNKVMRFMVQDEQGIRHELTCFTGHEVFDAYVEKKYSREDVERLYRGEGNIRLSILYYPGINEFQGRRNVQLVMQAYK